MARYSAEEYEALAEVRFLLEGLPSYEAIICFCSRSITRDKEELLKGMKGKSKRFKINKIGSNIAVRAS